MVSITGLDLSLLPPPDLVEPLDYEQILAAMVAELVARYPEFSALLESDPAFKILEVNAYRELLLRERVNDAARATMVAYATGADLDQIGANYGNLRLLISPADNSTFPPTPAVYESDDDYRARITLTLEGYTSAGSAGAYVFHAKSASGTVKDASATSPTPGQVVVYVLSREGDGLADTDTIEAVARALNAQTVRPLTDQVTVLSASIVPYEIEAVLTVYPGADPSPVLSLAREKAAAYAAAQHRCGRDVTLSGVYAALHQPGVMRVDLAQPADNLVIGEGEAAFCTGINVTLAALPDA